MCEFCDDPDVVYIRQGLKGVEKKKGSERMSKNEEEKDKRDNWMFWQGFNQGFTSACLKIRESATKLKLENAKKEYDRD